MREGYDPEAAEQMAQALPPFLQSLLPLPSPEEWLAPGPPRGARHGDYEIEAEIGRGGMGVVYRARQRSLNRTVALKLVLTGSHAGAEARRRFEAEARALAALRHPHIVQIHEVGEWPADGAASPLPFLCLEYVEGDSLADRLDGTPWPACSAAELVETLARAIQHAHECGIVHRDLKPANILLQKDLTGGNRENREKQSEEGPSASPSPTSSASSSSLFPLFPPVQFLFPKITDFGLARFLDGADGPTQSGALLGTPSYMAPEQAEGGRPVGPATDVYALGALLYELLTGRPPFRGASSLETLEQVRSQQPVPPRQLQPKLPRDLETIGLKCLQKEPAKRYATAAALADDLRRFRDGQPIQARPVGQAEQLWRWCRRKPAVATLTAALVVVLFAGLASGLYYGRRAVVGEQQALKNLDVALEARQVAEEREQTTQQILGEFVRLGAYHLPVLPGEPNTLGVEAFEKAEAHYQHLLQKHGTNPGLKDAAAAVYLTLGTSLLHKGRLEEAQPRFENARLLWEELLEKEAGNPAYLFHLGSAYHQLGEIHAHRGRLPEALQAHQQAQSLLEELVSLQPNPIRQLSLVQSGLTMSRILIATGRPDDSHRLLEMTHVHLEQLARAKEAEAGFHALLPELYGQLSEFYQKLGETAKAHQAKQEAEQIRQRRVIPSPANDLALAIELRKGVLLLTSSHNLEGEQKAALNCFRCLTNLLTPQTHNVVWTEDQRYELARCATEVAFYLHTHRPPAEALLLTEQANRSLRQLVQAVPERLEYGVGLSESWYLLGKIHWKLGQTEETLEAFRQAVSAQRRVVEQAPAVAEHRERLGERYLRLARKLCELGRMDDAEACILERQKLWPNDTERLHEVVRTLRRWAAEVGDGKGPLTPAEQQEKQRYLEFGERLERMVEAPSRR